MLPMDSRVKPEGDDLFIAMSSAGWKEMARSVPGHDEDVVGWR
jgi:hypothetical protein